MQRTSKTEIARRSDALYFGTTSRRELCNMIARIEHEIAVLKAEKKTEKSPCKPEGDML